MQERIVSEDETQSVDHWLSILSQECANGSHKLPKFPSLVLDVFNVRKANGLTLSSCLHTC